MQDKRQDERQDKGERDHDVVIWGATGFVGRLLIEYFGKTQPSVRWAIAGRSRSKLERIRAEVAAEYPAVADVPLLEADADDERSLETLASKTRVIATTVGPYWVHGKKLVAACVKQKTDYCDLTGEVPFIRWAIDEFHAAAKASRTRIVPTCGFDSIPSDLGVFFLAEHAKQQGKRLAEVRGFVLDSKGGVSGGTAASMMVISDLVVKDRAMGRLMMDPYSLSPDRGHELGTDGPDKFAPRFDSDLDVWTAPWLMAGVNTRVVRRSNALLGHAYGDTFKYSEELVMPGGRLGFLPAIGVSAAMAVGLALLAIGPTKRLIAKKLPASGEGPSKSVRERGLFALKFLGRCEGQDVPTLAATVTGRGDPGYLATSRMFAESAISLATDPPITDFEGGVLTPATAMGMQLVERLRRAEMTFEIVPVR